jgi:drug/metabolite transporter (DMT)-like permease
MLMGSILRNDRRPTSDYVMGICLALGAGLFFFSSKVYGHLSDSKDEIYFGSVLSGIILMIGYLFFDAFTLNWQKKLFDTKPKISRYQVCSEYFFNFIILDDAWSKWLQCDTMFGLFIRTGHSFYFNFISFNSFWICNRRFSSVYFECYWSM